MSQKEVLSLSQARAAIEAALLEASKEQGRPMAVAVVDEWGDLVYFGRMDGAYPLFVHMAIIKAYTASRMLRDTAAFAERDHELGRELATWGDDRLTYIRGGQCIVKPGEGFIPGNPNKGTVIGGIGASGRAPEEDEMIALAGLKAIKF